MVLRRVLAVLLSFLVPPVGIYLIRGVGLALYADAFLFLSALAVFFLLMALPGLAIWGLSVAVAVLVGLFGKIK